MTKNTNNTINNESELSQEIADNLTKTIISLLQTIGVDDPEKAKLINKCCESVESIISKHNFANSMDTVINDLLKDITSERFKPVFKAILENQYKALVGNNTSPNNPNAIPPNTILNVTKHALIAMVPLFDLVGVQPMQGPVGLCYSLQFKSQDKESVDSESGRRICLEVLSKAVEASSKRLRSHWTIEAAQDLSTFHNDVEDEMVKMLGLEISEEIVEMILSELVSLSSEPDTFVCKKDHPDSVSIDMLSVVIAKAANDIASDTRRGPANFIVVDPATLSLLQCTTTAKFEQYSDDDTEDANILSNGHNFKLKRVGTLNETIKVFCSMASDVIKNKILLGYKGSNEIDAGYFFLPYILLLSSGAVVDPYTFQPSVGFITRYATHANDDSHCDMSRGENYYRVLNLDIDNTYALGTLAKDNDNDGEDEIKPIN